MAINSKNNSLRDKILEQSWRLIMDKGLHALSFREVAKTCNVSHNAPYKYFNNQFSLLCALSAQGFELLDTQINITKNNHPLDPVKQLIESGVAYVNFAINHEHIFELMFGNKIPLTNIDEHLFEKSLQSFSSLEKIIIDGQKENIFLIDDSRKTALSCWALVHGIASLFISQRMNPLSQNICSSPLEFTFELCQKFAHSLCYKTQNN